MYLAGLRAVMRQYLGDARRAREIQHRTLMAKIRRNESSAYGRDFGFRDMRTVDDFRRRQPLMRYDDVEPYVEQVRHGNVTAMFSPHTKVLMYAMTSGTTGRPKHLPVTAELFREYSAGWRIWGAGVYGDHRDLVYKKTLQLSSDWQQLRAPDGTPCGQISGLAAASRPLVSRPVFMPPACVNRIYDSESKHYAALRLAAANPWVGMIITANPSTLVEFARRADKHRERLIRDIRDGTLTLGDDLMMPSEVRRQLLWRTRLPKPRRARQLERIVEQHGTLWPAKMWPRLSVVAVWTGGSVGVYLPQVKELYGNVAVRDHGLSASEGRMSIPLADGSSSGILDYRHHYFEFIPVDEYQKERPTVLEGYELEEGQDYYIVLTTSGGLYRYDIQDVIRCTGFIGEAPLIEFLNKGKNISNITGEKLTEHQVIHAVQLAFADLQLPVQTFTLAPTMDSYQRKPRYLLLVEPTTHGGRATELAEQVEFQLRRANMEYLEKAESGRLLPVEVHEVAPGTWTALRKQRTSERGNFEEYKHPCLATDLGFLERLVELGGPPRRFAAGA
jgi:hypothetical protein